MYINLKVHTDYSLLEASCKIDDYLKKAYNLGQKSIAVTNTSLFNTIEYYIKAKKMGIKPVIALEVKNEADVFSIYARNIDGYKALVKLASSSNVDILDIEKSQKDLIILNGGVNSAIYKLVLDDKFDKALELLNTYKSKFLNFYFELPSINSIQEKYLKLIEDSNVSFVITDDVYYLDENDKFLQLIVKAISKNRTVNKIEDEYKNILMHFKSFDEIKKGFETIDSEIFSKGIENVNKIVEDCNVEFNFNEQKIPLFREGVDDKKYLEELVYNGLKRIQKENDKRYIDRLSYELNIIDKMGFNSYFLITQDIVKYARDNNILVGVGRGSAAGSLVSFLLDITKIDPIKYKLIFERFLNPSRTTMPDIDLDFEAAKRPKIIRYVVERYGIDYVANIITFSTLKEKQIKNDLKKVMYYKLNRAKENEIINKLLNNVRHISTHASGVIISREKLIEEIPIIYDKDNNVNLTQYNMKELEKLGLLKMDFLALINLDIISETINMLNIKLDDISLDDKKAFELYNKGDTVGLFQVESDGITNLIKRFKINSVEDISAALALYRPGPLGSGMVDKVINVKNGFKNIEYDILDLKDILDETYGIMIYQEQVMMIAEKIASFSLAEADELRRAISKKIPSIIEEYKSKFIENAIKNKYNRKDVENLYKQIEAFADYGFNKAHSISYGITSYYTAYLKANHTKEYMTTLLNQKITDIPKLNLYFYELVKNDIKLLDLDINKSDIYFKVEDDAIRYGIYSVDGISKNLAMDIVKEREINGSFSNINDFAYRMFKYSISKKHIEILAKANAFNSFNISRKEIFDNVDEILEIAKGRVEADENIGKTLFFTEENLSNRKYVKKNIEEYSKKDIVSMEIDLLGLPLSYFNSKYYRALNKIFLTNRYINIAYILDRKRILINGRIYETSEIETNKIHKLCFVLKDRRQINGIYSFDVIEKLKDVSVEILLDGLSLEQKANLKMLLKNNKGSVKVNYYENGKKLKLNNYLNLNKKTVQSMIDILGESKLKIKITNLKF